jgi:hypothetical protein
MRARAAGNEQVAAVDGRRSELDDDLAVARIRIGKCLVQKATALVDHDRLHAYVSAMGSTPRKRRCDSGSPRSFSAVVSSAIEPATITS